MTNGFKGPSLYDPFVFDNRKPLLTAFKHLAKLVLNDERQVPKRAIRTIALGNTKVLYV